MKRLGNSTLDLTPVGLGAWAIGGEWRFGWGPQDDEDSIRTIRRAIDRGVNWIDTAAVYGLGHSEEVIGRALRGVPAAERPYVFTKCSLIWDASGTVSHTLSPDAIRQEVEGSLRRLQVEKIDLYQIHWPEWPGSAPGHDPGRVEDAWEALVSLKQSGKVSWIGVSNFNGELLRRIQRIDQPTSLQPPYSLLRREIEQDILPFCRQQNIGVIPYSPMQSGLLTGKMTRERIAALPEGDWRRSGRFFQEPQLTQALALADRLAEIGRRHGRSAGEIALAWVLSNPAVTAVIVGARRPEQIDELADAGSVRLAADEIAELNGFASATAG